MDDTQFTYDYFDENKQSWETLFDYEVFSKQSISILGFDKDSNFLYITALHEGRDALFKLNLTTKARELIYSNSKYDFDGSIFYSQQTGEVAGFTDSHLDDGIKYWDKDLDKLHRSLRVSLPKDEYKLDIVSTSKDQQKYILYISSDKTSGSYLFGDRVKKQVSAIADVYPQIDASYTEAKSALATRQEMA